MTGPDPAVIEWASAMASVLAYIEREDVQDALARAPGDAAPTLYRLARALLASMRAITQHGDERQLVIEAACLRLLHPPVEVPS